MKEILNHLFDHKTLSKSEAKETLTNIAKGLVNPAQLAAFCTVFRMRSITIDELEGFRDAMLDLCIKVDLGEYDAIDVCGTGGDSKNTFNISTLTTFVAAGAGGRVLSWMVPHLAGADMAYMLVHCTLWQRWW